MQNSHGCIRQHSSYVANHLCRQQAQIAHALHANRSMFAIPLALDCVCFCTGHRLISIPEAHRINAKSANSLNVAESLIPPQQPGAAHQAPPAQQRPTQQRPEVQASASEGSDGEGRHQQPSATLNRQGSKGLPTSNGQRSGHTR